MAYGERAGQEMPGEAVEVWSVAPVERWMVHRFTDGYGDPQFQAVTMAPLSRFIGLMKATEQTRRGSAVEKALCRRAVRAVDQFMTASAAYRTAVYLKGKGGEA